MKKFFKSFLTITLLLGAKLVFAADYDLVNVNPEFTGTYIPVCFDQTLRKTMSFDKGFMAYGEAKCILMLRENICYSDNLFHDGFAIKQKDFAKWNFIAKDSEHYILDENGCSYRRISKDYEHGYSVLYNYVLNNIFQDAVHFNNIRIENSSVFIDDEEFSPDFDASFCSGENVALWLTAKKSHYALCIEGLGAKLYKCGRGQYAMEIAKTDEVYKTIPYFYWKNNSYPKVKDWNLTKDEYRFIRNLVYAKHGYTFKSADLNSIFGNTDFYVKNPNFSENDFTEEEKKLLKDIQNREAQLN